MKKHSGKKIQKLAMAFLSVMTIIAAAAAIAVIVLMKEHGEVTALGLLVGFVVFGLGYFLGWAAAQLLQGFAELVENSAETASYSRILAVHFATDTVKAMEEEAGKAAEP